MLLAMDTKRDLITAFVKPNKAIVAYAENTNF
jgi:hypothetical protein